MELNEFVNAVAAEFFETKSVVFTPKTVYKELDEWGSLTVLSLISLVDDEFGKTITGADLRSCNTIEELYNLIMSK